MSDVQLGSLVRRTVGGGTPSRAIPEFWQFEIPWASVKDVSSSGRNLRETEESISEAGLRASTANLVKAGTPIIAMRMAVGAVATFSEEVAINQDLRALLPSEGVDETFLYYLLESLSERLANLGVGSTVKGIRLEHLLRMPISAPPEPEEQRRIADLLSAVDEQIEAVGGLAEKQEEVRRAVEIEVFARISATATKRQISSFAKVGGGKRLPSGHDYSRLATGFRYLRVTDFFGQPVDFHSLQSLQPETFDMLRHYELEAGDVYISIAGSIGWSGVMPETESLRVILTENAAKIRLEDFSIFPEYLSLFINSQVGQQQIAERIGTGGGVPKLALERIRTIQVPLPSDVEQRDALRLIGTLSEEVRELRNEQAKLVRLKQALMQRFLRPTS